ncbi:MAG TPA: cytochrome c3 family protein [Pyrinomonadaceae bacterium]|jgi:DNA-directed RNA polymerase subunit RPC12/RpoP|nr:cytochrome c3 family protein [Pyrinomonadaceae bacterium]
MQVFHRSTNTIAKVSIFGGVFIVAASLWVLAEINRSAYNTGQFIEVQQPVQFSHKHHVGDDGIDCRYCHTSVETSNTAGLPPTKTCMNCHSQIYSDSRYLEIVRASFRDNKPLEWTRVHDLPDFVYFNHSIHVNKGVGCASCHGRVDQMPMVYQAASLQMEWCLACHRAPERYLRPKEKITDMAWNIEADPGAGVVADPYNTLAENTAPSRVALGLQLKKDYHIRNARVLTSCSTCHR